MNLNTDSLGIIGLILTAHGIADFVFQTSWQAENKSSRWDALLAHTSTYSAYWIVVLFVTNHIMPLNWSIYQIIAFTLVTFVCHTITDYFTSRWTKKLYLKGDAHNFFVVIEMDQWIHYAQLFLTFYYVAK